MQSIINYNVTLFELENLYLTAKIAYYEGEPFLSDLQFDELENFLKSKNSKVTNQVGSKRKDFDFEHPHKMLSLDKIQTESNDNKKEEFYDWFQSNYVKINNNSVFNYNISESSILLKFEPKYDGNAVNLIYKGNELLSIVTRGDGYTGKNVTNKLINDNNKILLANINIDNNAIYEVRCEAIISLENFNKINKEREENGDEIFANARNFVAGLLGKDDVNYDYLQYIDLIPLHFLKNGEHLDITKLNNSSFNIIGNIFEYENILNEFIKLRETFKYGLDGIVVSLDVKYRELLGENEKSPKWSCAIKFVPDVISSEVIGIEWNVGKTRELTPVILLNPIELAGTIVKRASGYNAGFIIENKIGIGSKVTLVKRGDIIPAIDSVLTPSDIIEIPKICPACHDILELNDMHLTCINDECIGAKIKQFGVSAKTLNLKGVAEKTLEPFAYGDYTYFLDLFINVLNNKNRPEFFEQFGFKQNSKSLDAFIKSFTNIKTISMSEIIQSLGWDNVGKSLATEVTKYYCDVNYSFKGHEKKMVEIFKLDAIKNLILEYCDELESLGIKIERPFAISNIKDIIYVECTGSPKPNWKTKEEFITYFNNVEQTSLTDNKCNYLITDSYDSKSNKMSVANKKNINIITYNDFYEKFAKKS